MIDAHTHVNQLTYIHDLVNHSIEAIINVSSYQEYLFLKPYFKYPHLHFSYGIHPWHVNETKWNEFEPLFKDASIIGEIGMDNVWCDTPIEIQKEVFEKQLQKAKQRKLPTILHTKGQEKEVLSMIKKYPNKYLVHWYSCLRYLEDYIKLDCYFTVGPNLDDPAVKQVVESVPLNRLLIESDGLSSIAWVKGKDKISFEKYMSTLNDTLIYISLVKNKSIHEVEKMIQDNLHDFLGNR